MGGGGGKVRPGKNMEKILGGLFLSTMAYHTISLGGVVLLLLRCYGFVYRTGGHKKVNCCCYVVVIWCVHSVVVMLP